MPASPIGSHDGFGPLKPASTKPFGDSPIPGVVRPPAGIDKKKLRMRYASFDMRDPGDLAEIERIETLAFRDEGIYIWDKKNYIFMDKMYYLVQWLESTE